MLAVQSGHDDDHREGLVLFIFYFLKEDGNSKIYEIKLTCRVESRPPTVIISGTSIYLIPIATSTYSVTISLSDMKHL